jgi:hypothetical protein
MSIRMGIYDFFAYTVPGGLYILTIVYSAMTFGLATIDIHYLSTLSAIQAIVIAFAAHITGLVIDPIARLWYRVFMRSYLPQKVLDEFKATHANLDVKFQAKDWPILLAFLKRENVDVATDIEKNNATRIMLRSISFISIVNSVIQLGKSIQIHSVWNLVLCLALLAFSILAGRQSARYDRWFYLSIYESSIAHSPKVLDSWFLEQKTKTQQQSPEA